MNYGILVILPNVVVYEDVLNILVKGVDPQRLAATNREGITRPPGEESWAQKDVLKVSEWIEATKPTLMVA